jgi:DNA-binding LytR/AlgR family response regulator
MPELNGFDVAKATQGLTYQLIFMTSYEQYALKAFDTNAIDYLVKPARPELIAKSIGRYRRVHLTAQGASIHSTDTIISEQTLDGFCTQLPDSQFYRLHRSYIINATQLLELKYHTRKHFVLLAGTDVQIPVSRSFIHTLKERITTR